MKIESICLQNFRCFGPRSTKIDLETGITTFVGGNGAGKTAVFQALSRLFGVTTGHRTVHRRDFHVAVDQHELQSGTTLFIDVVFSFPELEEDNEEIMEDAVPEFFSQMAASAPGAPLNARMRLQAVWTDDGTPDGNIDEDVRWITTLSNDFMWDECKKVQALERGSIQLVYVPATRDAATQVTSLLKGRLWRAAKWSETFREQSSQSTYDIQEHFEMEEPTKFIINRLSKRWKQIHDADTESVPALRLVDSRFEELVRQAQFTFYPDEEGRERNLVELSDGQRSLFHIALTAATLEAEAAASTQHPEHGCFDQEKLRKVHLTLFAIEEPENNLSPFFLSRIITQAREIAARESAQVLLSSHSSAILSRIEPEEVRYFRLNRRERQADVRRLTLPEDDEESSRYVRLAVRAYPELYFARFVILGEGDSEQIVIPRIAEASNIQLDPSFVPVVPLGGRYVGHFWKLLDDLHIPYATLVDLDLGRSHGGAKRIRDIESRLSKKKSDNELGENTYANQGSVNPQEIEDLEDEAILGGYEENNWLQALKKEGVFFSYPLDIDFSMLRAFQKAYQRPNPGGKGPRRGDKVTREKKLVTLKTGGNPKLYDKSYDEEFIWYPYLFFNRSKPETHLTALSHISDADLARHAPPELKALIAYIRGKLGLDGGD